MKKLILFVLSAALLLSGCTSTDETGNFQIYLTDQPIEADEIWVTITEINVQKEEEGFLTVWEGTKEYDLLALRNKEALILDTGLGAGTYTQIRLVVASGRIVIGGTSQDMTVPSSEVKIPVDFEILGEGATEIVLDFEADNSIHVVYTAGENAAYILRPVIIVKSITY